MKIKAGCHAALLVWVFTAALMVCAPPARAQLAQLTAVPVRQPAIGEEYTYLTKGLFAYAKTDLSLPGPMPISVTRVYRSDDKTPQGSGFQQNNRAFGLATRLNYDVSLYYVGLNSNNQYEWDVEMPDSAALDCTSNSSSGPFTCNNQPAGVWFNSTLSSDSSGFSVVRPDGTTYQFDNFGSGTTRYWLLVTITDHYGNQIAITRGNNASGACPNSNAQTGYVSEVSEYLAQATSPARYVCFTYGGSGSNDPNAIYEIYDNAGIKQVSYSYDSTERLSTVTQTAFNTNAITTYKYNQSTPSPTDGITEIDVNDECTGANWTTSCSPVSEKTFITYETVVTGANFLQSISSQLPGNGYQYGYTFDSTNTYVTKVSVTLPDSSVRKLFFDQAGYVTQDNRNPSQSNEEITSFIRNWQTVGNSSEFISYVYEMDSSNNLWRATSYDYNATTGDVVGVWLNPAPGQNDSNCENSPGCVVGDASTLWSYTYESPGTGFNRLLTAVEPMAYNNTGWTYSYNDSTPSVTITDPLGRVTTITENAQGQPISIEDPANHTPTKIAYDGSANLTSVTDPMGNTTNYTPDPDGRVQEVVSPLGRATLYAYDPLDDVTSVTVDPTGLDLVTRYAYDLLGQPRSTTTPNGNTTTTTYNAVLSKITVTDPLGNTAVTDLDGHGRKTDFTDQRGIETTYKYDLFGRVTKTVFNSNTPSGSPQPETVTFNGFDALDRPTSVSDSLSGTLNYSYDPLDNVLSESDSYNNNSMTYGYDSNGRRISMQGTMNGNAQPAVNYGYDCADELIGITTAGSGYSNPPNCSPSTSVTNGSACTSVSSTQVGINYDADGMPNCIQSDGVETNFTPRDEDERVVSQMFSFPASGYSYSDLTYSYDADGLVTNKGGGLAAVNIPAATSTPATYNADDQIATWNGNTVNSDAATNITQDPASGYSIGWTSRNQVAGIGVGLNEVYDASGRREFEGGSDTLRFLHDGSSVAGWLDVSTGNYWDFLQGGGATLAGSYTASGTTTSSVPLIDASGSTIALVNPASPSSVATTYTYDPFGTPTMSGTSNNWPFQYQGMEHEFIEPNQYYYSGDGAFYSAQIMRSLSETSTQGTNGPGAGPGRAHLPAVEGGNGSFGHWYVDNVLNPNSTGNQLGNLPDIGFITSEGTSYFIPVGEIAQIIEEWVSFFEWLFGGSPSYPPNYFLFQHRLTFHRHPLYPSYDGIPLDIVASQGSEAPEVQPSMPPSNQPPLQRPDFLQVAFQEPRVVDMPLDQPIPVFNTDGSADYELTCRKNGDIEVDDFKLNRHYTRSGSLTVPSMGVQTTYICSGTLAND